MNFMLRYLCELCRNGKMIFIETNQESFCRCNLHYSVHDKVAPQIGNFCNCGKLTREKEGKLRLLGFVKEKARHSLQKHELK